jgi:hypothetical protein
MKSIKMVFVLGLMLGTAQLGHASTFYKWVDAQGATHYSQQPQYNVKNVQTVTVYKDPNSLSDALQRLRSDGCQILRVMLPRAQARMDEYTYSQRAQVESAQRTFDTRCE